MHLQSTQNTPVASQEATPNSISDKELPKHSEQAIQSIQGKKTPIQAKQRPVNKSNPEPRTIDPFYVKPESADTTGNTPVQRKANNTGLPDHLKTGVENLSGYSMDDVKVHYNSDKPAQLQAHAYAQGTDIHVASGQEKHLPHEAWHVVQQKQGRVQPTQQLKSKGVNVNDDVTLEKEADIMGAKAQSLGSASETVQPKLSETDNKVASGDTASIQMAKTQVSKGKNGKGTSINVYSRTMIPVKKSKRKKLFDATQIARQRVSNALARINELFIDLLGDVDGGQSEVVFRNYFGMLSASIKPFMTALHLQIMIRRINKLIAGEFSVVDTPMGTSDAGYVGTTDEYDVGDWYNPANDINADTMSNGRIHVNIGDIRSNDLEDAAITIIHEASHKVCATKDYLYVKNKPTSMAPTGGYEAGADWADGAGRTEGEGQALAPGQADAEASVDPSIFLSNADTIAFFIMDLGV